MDKMLSRTNYTTLAKNWLLNFELNVHFWSYIHPKAKI